MNAPDACCMNPFPDQADREPVPITVWLTPAQFARMETITAGLLTEGTCADEDAATDYIFDAGIDLIELVLNMESPADT
jgi:hypothetical protein